MKIFIYHNGDRSVGINGDEVTIEWEGMPRMDKDEREALRRDLKHFWDDAFDFRCYVRFDDECPECHQIMANYNAELGLVGRCTNPQCGVNMPDIEDETITTEMVEAQLGPQDSLSILPGQLQALKILDEATAGTFDLRLLMGCHYAHQRQDVICLITGKKPTLAKSGISHLKQAVIKCLGAKGDCKAAVMADIRDKALAALRKE